MQTITSVQQPLSHRFEPAHHRHLRIASQRLLNAILREHPERRRVR